MKIADIRTAGVPCMVGSTVSVGKISSTSVAKFVFFVDIIT